jgi:SagB-type dehydrogenase family enzyme
MTAVHGSRSWTGEDAARESAELVALRPGVFSATAGDGAVHLIAWPHAEALGVLSPGQREILRALARGLCARADLHALGRECDGDSDGTGGSAGAGKLISQLLAGGWLSVTVTFLGRGLYALDPLRPPPPRPGMAVPDLALSRFAIVRSSQDGIVVESPRAWCDLRILDATTLGVIGELAGAGASTQVLPARAAERMRRDLQWAGLAGPPDDGESTQLRLRQWKPHELWFHERSRLGYRGGFGDGFGGTFWAKGTFDPPTARHDRFSARPIDLYRPDLSALRQTDPTLTTVLEDRRSVRRHDEDNPVTMEQLGEFLYRCARTRLVRTLDGFEYTSKPYPSGGSAYELELYPVVRHAQGLAPGMYHYDSLDHQLRMVRDANHPAVRRLLRVAAVGAVGGGQPQVLIVVGARVGRLMWKYESMPYALILKHVGVLYQTMYCVAAAMGLGACALGSGDASAFTEASGLDPLVECSVGEFILGGCPAGEPT